MKALLCKYRVLLPVTALLFGITACDSNDEAKPDEEIFIDSWAVTSVSDATGPADLAANFNSIVATFNADGSGSIAVDAVDDAGDATLSVTWTINESTKTIVINISVPGVGTIPLNMGYSISGDENSITFSISQANAVLINSLFGTDLEGAVTMTITRVP